jgi:hypothetical protein
VQEMATSVRKNVSGQYVPQRTIGHFTTASVSVQLAAVSAGPGPMQLLAAICWAQTFLNWTISVTNTCACSCCIFPLVMLADAAMPWLFPSTCLLPSSCLVPCCQSSC